MATKKTAKPAPKVHRLQAITADFTTRAKAAQATLAGRRAEAVKFGNDNLAAVKASGTVVVTGVKPLAELAVGNTRNLLQAFTASVQGMKGVKSPVELFKLQCEAGKAVLATARTDTQAFGQAVVKLAGDAAAPLKDRFAAVRKLAA